MGLFDFIFGNKRKEEERLEREHAQRHEQEREKIAKETKLSDNNQNTTFSIPKPDTNVFPVDENISGYFESLASQINFALSSGNERIAIQQMNLLFDQSYGSNGHKLLNVDPQSGQCIGLAFAKIAMYLDFNDQDLNSVAAENAFYCLSKNFISTGNNYVTPALFTLLFKHSVLLNDKLLETHCNIIQKSYGMPIGIILGGNPFSAPHLIDFRKEAYSKRISIMAYLLTSFYDTNKSKYLIPTDLTNYHIPSVKDINEFKKLTNNLDMSIDNIINEGQRYFYSMFEECQSTLSKF